ncbi:hypothetical protein ACQY0O_003557 [Thecaphora frezii]
MRFLSYSIPTTSTSHFTTNGFWPEMSSHEHLQDVSHIAISQDDGKTVAAAGSSDLARSGSAEMRPTSTEKEGERREGPAHEGKGMTSNDERVSKKPKKSENTSLSDRDDTLPVVDSRTDPHSDVAGEKSPLGPLADRDPTPDPIPVVSVTDASEGKRSGTSTKSLASVLQDLKNKVVGFPAGKASHLPVSDDECQLASPEDVSNDSTAVVENAKRATEVPAEAGKDAEPQAPAESEKAGKDHSHAPQQRFKRPEILGQVKRRISVIFSVQSNDAGEAATGRADSAHMEANSGDVASCLELQPEPMQEDIATSTTSASAVLDERVNKGATVTRRLSAVLRSSIKLSRKAQSDRVATDGMAKSELSGQNVVFQPGSLMDQMVQKENANKAEALRSVHRAEKSPKKPLLDVARAGPSIQGRVSDASAPEPSRSPSRSSWKDLRDLTGIFKSRRVTRDRTEAPKEKDAKLLADVAAVAPENATSTVASAASTRNKEASAAKHSSEPPQQDAGGLDREKKRVPSTDSEKDGEKASTPEERQAGSQREIPKEDEETGEWTDTKQILTSIITERVSSPEPLIKNAERTVPGVDTKGKRRMMDDEPAAA